MGACDDISAYLDNRLEGGAAERFEAHLEGCPACRRAVEAWRTIAARIVDVSATDAAATDPSTHEQLLLVQRAELEQQLPRLRVVRLALAASVLLAAGVIVGYWLSGPSARAPVGRDPGDAPEEGLIYRTDASSRTTVQLGDDAIHLGPASDVRVLEQGEQTRLELLAGSLACEVTARRGGGRFTVAASELTVRVTGTRFLVDLGAGDAPARVVVAAGTVEVRGGASSQRLDAGEELELDGDVAVGRASADELAAIDRLFGGPSRARETVAATASEEGADLATEQPDSDAAPETAGPSAGAAGARVPEPDTDTDEVSLLERWRGWVIEGRLDEARSALRAHVGAHPADAEAWSLLADCERKRGSWDAAVAAYEELISLSGGEQANRARFKAAQLLQDRLGDHRRAAELLERFVASVGGGSLLVDKARVRLARSLIALGRTDRARAQLERVIGSGSDGKTVATARQMLEKLDRE